MTQTEQPADDDAAPFDSDAEDEGAEPVYSWLGAAGQMIAALLVVAGLVALFIGVAVAFRWLFP